MSENNQYGAEGFDANASHSAPAPMTRRQLREQAAAAAAAAAVPAGVVTDEVATHSTVPHEPAPTDFAATDTVATDTAVNGPAVTDAAPHEIVLPLTRRERRELESAALAQAAAPPPAEQVPPAETPVSFTLEPETPVSLDPVQDAWAVQAFAAGSVGSDVLPVGISKKAPKKPKTLKSVRLPRGMSRPSAKTRPVGPTSHSRPKSFKRQFLSKLMTLGAMVGAGLMMVSTSIPANAFFPVEAVTGTIAVDSAEEAVEVQSVSVQAVGEEPLSRDSYTAVSLKERLFLEYGNRSWAYTNNPNGTIQWPFPVAVPISSGFGPRIAPCGGCSSFHEGVDFTPGGGTLIQAIADGVVSTVGDNSWGLGTYVVIDHHINGNLVQSYYGHMMRGSTRVEVGQQVKVTDILGAVGSTGASTGSHLHLEIHVNGVQANPFDWLKANAN